MSPLKVPSRKALEMAEAFIAQSRGGIPNPDNVDVWMRAPESWSPHIIFASYIEQQEQDLRDRFAGQALQGLLAYPDGGDPGNTIEAHCSHISDMAYRYADAMLEARMEGRP